MCGDWRFTAAHIFGFRCVRCASEHIRRRHRPTISSNLAFLEESELFEPDYNVHVSRRIPPNATPTSIQTTHNATDDFLFVHLPNIPLARHPRAFQSAGKDVRTGS